MSRCPFLYYESHSLFGNADDEYICKECHKRMPVDASEVKYVCKGDYDAYKRCPIYQNS